MTTHSEDPIQIADRNRTPLRPQKAAVASEQKPARRRAAARRGRRKPRESAAARGRSRRASATGNCAAAASIFNHAPTRRARPTFTASEIYRWQIGNSLSILHRLTGIALALRSAGALSYWLVSLAGGETVLCQGREARLRARWAACVSGRLDLLLSRTTC